MSNTRELKPNQRESIANATQLIREAGFSEKADLLDDMLQDGDIDIDDDLDSNILGQASKVILWPFEIRLSEQISINRRCLPGILNPVFERNSPELVKLAMILHHEADHILCDDELAAFGGEIHFAKVLNADFDKFFPGLTPEEKAIVEAQKLHMEAGAEVQRRKIARKGGRGYGKGHKTHPKIDRLDVAKVLKAGDIPTRIENRIFPSEIIDPTEKLIDFIGNKILLFEELNGRLPKNISELIKHAETILDINEYAYFQSMKRKEKGIPLIILDCWGYPLKYKVPGNYFKDRFDLYSLGECGQDKNGEDPNILFSIGRR